MSHPLKSQEHLGEAGQGNVSPYFLEGGEDPPTPPHSNSLEEWDKSGLQTPVPDLPYNC